MYKIETERGDLFDINMMITMQVTVSGRSSEAALSAAFREAAAAFEILNSRVVIDKNGTAYYDSCENSANSITFRDFELEELIRENERRRFALEDGEFLRCFVSLSDDERMKMCFMMHHLGGDGKSLCYFIEAFLKALSGEKTGYRKIMLITNDTLPRDCKLTLLAKWVVKTCNKKWRKERRVFGFDDMKAAYQLYWKDHRSVVRNEVTESEALGEKLKICKENRIGFTSYTIAEMIQNSPAAQDVGLAVDARQDGNRTMSNQATGIAVKYKYDSRRTPAENASVIDGMMKKKLRNLGSKFLVLRFMSAFDPTLVDAVNLEFAGYFHSPVSAKLAKILGYGTNTKDLSITNLTRLDIPDEYGSCKLTDLIFVPPVVSYGKNIVGMVTVGGHLNTTYHTIDVPFPAPK